MESIPKKGYFAKELALRTLFGDQAFTDLKKLLDPCCGIGVDKICVEPCGGTPTMCPEITITSAIINCVTGECTVTIVSANTGGAAICGRVQVQVLLPDTTSTYLTIDIDNFCITGDGTTIVNIPGICSLYSIGIFEFGPFPFINANFLAYSPSGPASNIFPASSVSITCPKILLCEGDSGDCLPISCVDGQFQLLVDVDTYQTSSTLIVQWSLNTDPEVWTNLGAPITALPYLTPHTEPVDASALSPETFYKIRVIDSVDNTITSSVQTILTPTAC